MELAKDACKVKPGFDVMLQAPLRGHEFGKMAMADLLWGSFAHYTDTMNRCVLSLYYQDQGSLSVETSYALIRDPIVRAVSAWDWMAQHQPSYTARLTFEQFVQPPDASCRSANSSATGCMSLLLHPFGVPQCAFVATR
eukprot:3542746-Prymnesium_polylepis.2